MEAHNNNNNNVPERSQWRYVVQCGKGGACLRGDGHHNRARGGGSVRGSEARHKLLHRLLLEEHGLCRGDAAAACEAIVQADLDWLVGGGWLGLMECGRAWLQAHLAHLMAVVLGL